MSNRGIGFSFIAFFVLLLTQPLWAAEHTVFGPQRFERGKGKPVRETVTFSSIKAGPDFLIEVRNGDSGKEKFFSKKEEPGKPSSKDDDKKGKHGDTGNSRGEKHDCEHDDRHDDDGHHDGLGKHRVTSAVVTLNGKEIFGPSDFNRNAAILSKKISLKTKNELSVKIEGSPESHITIVIIGYDANTAPIAQAQSVSTQEDSPATITLTATDADQNSLTFRILSSPAHGALSGTTPSLTYTPAANYNGSDSFTFEADDGTASSAPATVTITVIPINDPPIARDDPVEVLEDAPIAIHVLANDTDVDNDPFTIMGYTQPANGTVVETSAGTLTYSPRANYNGADSFSYVVTDGKGSIATANVIITVKPVNDPPQADAGPDRTIVQSETVILDASGSSDIDGDSLFYSWTIINKPVGGTPILSTPDQKTCSFSTNLPGVYTLNLRVNDGQGSSNSDTVIITVNPKMIAVPDVKGIAQDFAQTVIQVALLQVGAITTGYSSTVPEGFVITQSPAAMSMVEQGSKVNLLISLGPEPKNPVLTFSVAPATIRKGENAVLSWSVRNANNAFIDQGIGAVALEGIFEVMPEYTTTYVLTVPGTNGATSAKATVTVTGNPTPQPEGSFGANYQGITPTDATVTTYNPKRFALITGNVQNESGSPLADVAITLHDHPEYGTARTNSGGDFTIPIDGGGTMTVVYTKNGYLTTHRQVVTPWNDWAIAETVRLVREDIQSTTITFDGNPGTIITHQSSTITDSFGSRSATMVFTGDNQAYLADEAGNTVMALGTITARATEFKTPEVMPAKLPPNSGFTYCVELAVDGASRVHFAKPVITWVDNFLGFAVGEPVPVGYYDRDRGVWVPSDNGMVVRLLDENRDGIVDALDANGDDLPDDLNGDGFFYDEVEGLNDPLKYTPEATFWRVAVTHFTPWDCNWPYVPPADAMPPNPEGIPDSESPCPDCVAPPNDCDPVNSYVKKRGRVFHEDIPIPGTDMALHYASNRTPGYRQVITVPASGATVPASLKQIVVTAQIAGKTFEQTLDPLPNQQAVFEWDGLDNLNRKVVSSITAFFNIGFVYKAEYLTAGNFAQAFAQAGNDVTGILSRKDLISWRRQSQTISIPVSVGRGMIAEGWTISSHHYLTTSGPPILDKGDGSQLQKNTIITTATIAGNGGDDYSGDGGPATEAGFDPVGLVLDSIGNIYIADYWNSRIRKVDTNGTITTVAGTGEYDFSGDGGPATEAALESPCGVAVDNAGNLYIADEDSNRIRKVDTNGIIITVAGNGDTDFYGDGGPATEAALDSPCGVAVDNAGNIYIADQYNNRIRKIDINGIITTVAGNGEENFCPTFHTPSPP